jgi:uncharacterized small protein (TIGR04563 family)
VYGSRHHPEPKAKRSFYIPEEMLAEIQAESRRQDRPISWLMEAAWRISRAQIQATASADELVASAGGSR